jgi:RNA polymerase sigma factor (TIGR02999 family)
MADEAVPDPLTLLLRRVQAGEPGARDALFAEAYTDLRVLARARLRDGGRGTLDTTALVHECYLRLQPDGRLLPEDRRAFFAYAARTMRSVIIDAVRERLAERRGGELDRLTLDTELGAALPDPAHAPSAEVLKVHDALEALAQTEPRLVQMVELRYFGGFVETEIADILGQSERTVRRDWLKARALLAALLDGG